MKDTINIIKKEVDNAIKKFGTYTYFDKGPYEVMDVGKIISLVINLDPKQISEVLNGLYASKDENHSYLSSFIVDYLGERMNEKDFDLVMNGLVNGLK